MESIFKNEILEVVNVKEHKGYNEYDYTFVGQKGGYSTNEKGIQEFINKRIRAYNLIPAGCTVIPATLIGLFQGMFVGGVLADSVYTVYGLVGNNSGLHGYHCSIYFLPTKEVLESIMNYSSVHGEFDKKERNFDLLEIKQ